MGSWTLCLGKGGLSHTLRSGRSPLPLAHLERRVRWNCSSSAGGSLGRVVLAFGAAFHLWADRRSRNNREILPLGVYVIRAKQHKNDTEIGQLMDKLVRAENNPINMLLNRQFEPMVDLRF